MLDQRTIEGSIAMLLMIYICGESCLFSGYSVQTMTVHGVAGYVSGCRCEQCFAAQRLRERQLALASEVRWAAVLRQIEQGEAQSVVAKRPEWRGSRADDYQRMVEVAQLELRRQQRSVERQRKDAGKQETARQRARAAQEMQERYERALDEGDFQWLLLAERRAVNSLRTRINRLVSGDNRQGCAELLWRQAQQTRELAEVHYRELKSRVSAGVDSATLRGSR